MGGKAGVMASVERVGLAGETRFVNEGSGSSELGAPTSTLVIVIVVYSL